MSQAASQPDSGKSPLSAAPIPAHSAAQRHDGWTPQRQRAFCEELAESGSVEQAAAAVGMSRQSAYAFRRRLSGCGFGLAWDAALLLARQRLIDDAFELASRGSLEQVYQEGKLIAEKRRRDPRSLLATIERLGSDKILGSAAVSAVADDFDGFLDCLDADAANKGPGTAHFMELRAQRVQFAKRENLASAGQRLAKARWLTKQAAKRLLPVHPDAESASTS